MITNEMYSKLISLTGLNYLGADRHIAVDTSGKLIDSYLVTALWYAKINYYIPRIKDTYLCIWSSETWQKGLLWVPHLEELPNVQNVSSPTSLPLGTTLDLTGWSDPLPPTLHSVDVMPLNESMARGTAAYNFYLCVSTLNCETKISYSGASKTPSLLNVWKALQFTIHKLIYLYNIPELYSFIYTKPASSFDSETKEI